MKNSYCKKAWKYLAFSMFFLIMIILSTYSLHTSDMYSSRSEKTWTEKIYQSLLLCFGYKVETEQLSRLEGFSLLVLETYKKITSILLLYAILINKTCPEIIEFSVLNVIVFLLSFLIIITLCVIRSRKKSQKSSRNSINHRMKIQQKKNESKRVYVSLHDYYQNRCFNFVFVLCMLFFCISVPWEFVRLYQHEVAERAALTFKGVPDECMPSEMSVLSSLFSWVLQSITWDHDPCKQYHKALLVDPIWEVTPLMVVCSAFTRCITKPLEILCSSVGRSLKVLFAEVPAQWQPVLMCILTLLTLTLSIMVCSYSVHLPMFVKIEPSYRKTSSCDSNIKSVTASPKNGCSYNKDRIKNSNQQPKSNTFMDNIKNYKTSSNIIPYTDRNASNSELPFNRHYKDWYSRYTNSISRVNGKNCSYSSHDVSDDLISISSADTDCSLVES